LLGRYTNKYIAAAPNAMSTTLSMKPPMMALVENSDEEEDEAAADCVLLFVGDAVAKRLVGAAGSGRVGRRRRSSPHGAQRAWRHRRGWRRRVSISSRVQGVQIYVYLQLSIRRR